MTAINPVVRWTFKTVLEKLQDLINALCWYLRWSAARDEH